MQKRREFRGRGSTVRRGVRYFSKGIGLFKLAAGLVAIASVLFLVPGLRLLVPGLQNIGTGKIQAMPVKNSQEQEKVPAEPESDNVQERGALNFSGDNELGLTGVFNDPSDLGFSAGAIRPGRDSSVVIDVGDELFSPQNLPDNFGGSGYKESSVINSDSGMSVGLAGGLSR